MHVGVVLRTLRSVGARRAALRALRRWRGALRGTARRLGAGPGAASLRNLSLAPAPALENAWTGTFRFRFLEVERDLGDPPDWSTAPSRLWGYHLHYLDVLRQRDRSTEEGAGLLEAWIRGNPFGSRPGWEPFPLSLRLVNALEILSSSGGGSPEAVRSLALQAWWLEALLERDLGANHLWKNGLALAWAGRLLESRDSGRWRRKGDGIVRDALDGHVLPDGFHFERTPGYHAVFVEDLLRLTALLGATDGAREDLSRRALSALAASAGALASVVHGDGEIPLFNDSAFGQAPAAADLLAAAAERTAGVGGFRADPRGAVAAGLHRLASGDRVLLIDAGDTACREQPGHAHADTFSFEVSCGRDRVIVDAGVHDYESSEERRYARSTAAHNTVEVDGADQSELWGSFRAGRLASVVEISRSGPEGRETIEAVHDGYARLPGKPLHRRRVQVLREGFAVEDRVEGRGRHRAVGRVRFHPALEVRLVGPGEVEAVGERVSCRLLAGEGTPLALEEGVYFPRFGRKERATVVRMERDGDLPVRFSYRLFVSRRD